MGSGPHLGASPLGVLAALRGNVIAVRVGHPDVLQLEVIDAAGGRWLFLTQDAEWRPADPSSILGRSIEDVRLDPRSGDLCFELSGGERLRVVPGPPEADDDPPSWELVTPERALLEFGPGIRWRISSADESLPPSGRPRERLT